MVSVLTQCLRGHCPSRSLPLRPRHARDADEDGCATSRVLDVRLVATPDADRTVRQNTCLRRISQFAHLMRSGLIRPTCFAPTGVSAMRRFGVNVGVNDDPAAFTPSVSTPVYSAALSTLDGLLPPCGRRGTRPLQNPRSSTEDRYAEAALLRRERGRLTRPAPRRGLARRAPVRRCGSPVARLSASSSRGRCRVSHGARSL